MKKLPEKLKFKDITYTGGSVLGEILINEVRNLKIIVNQIIDYLQSKESSSGGEQE